MWRVCMVLPLFMQMLFAEDRVQNTIKFCYIKQKSIDREHKHPCHTFTPIKPKTPNCCLIFIFINKS
uniref:Uncharacterized protein n=1 Tax=Oryzias latipes TaxID=8090 RepID=A0A3B3HJX2_ORYLA